LNTPV